MGEPQAAPADVTAVIEKARACFDRGVTRGYAWRVERLKALDAALRAHEQQLFDALASDLGKPLHESYPGEVGWLYQEIRLTLKDLKEWMRPQSQATSFTLWPASSWLYPEPLGTALIIGPWNYPLQLLLTPLVGALSAGCTAVVKPSELAPATASVVERLLTQAFGNEGSVGVVQGGPEASQALLAQRFDTIFFTGSTRVGQIVAEAAAKHLTPVTLELGGKSPAIIDADVDLVTAARRIAWGRFYNAGQSCVAPDYVLVHRSRRAELVKLLQQHVRDFFGDDPQQSKSFGRIISSTHAERLKSLLSGGTVAFGGQVDVAQRYVAPTVLIDVDVKSALMQEEIFGPLLPLIEVDSVEEAIAFVRARPKPLALYSFASRAEVNETVFRQTSSGGAMANDVVLQFISPDLPFGGVGASGQGRYHGKYSFDAFTHFKSVIKRPFSLDPLVVRYPPYKLPLALFRKLVR